MRARNIKPGFYLNEDLAECSIWARYIAPGLWMMADREGRLEDRPKRIKRELMPYDNSDVDPLLQELHDHGHIKRYEVNGKRYIQILKFSEHQNPHYMEKESIIPDMDGNFSASSEEKPEKKDSSSNKEPKKNIPSSNSESRKKPPSSMDESRAPPGMKGGVISQMKGGSASSDSLIPDSLIQGTTVPKNKNARVPRAQFFVDDFLLPDWIPPDVWEAFMEVRKVKKAADTSRAKRSIIKRLEHFRAKGHDPTELIEKSIRNSWKDVFEPNEESHANATRTIQKNPSSGSKTSESLAALYAAGNRVIERRGLESAEGQRTSSGGGMSAGDSQRAESIGIAASSRTTAGNHGLLGKADVALSHDQHD